MLIENCGVSKSSWQERLNSSPLPKTAADSGHGPFADETRNMLGDYAFTAAYDLPDGTKGGAGVYTAVKERFANRSVT